MQKFHFSLDKVLELKRTVLDKEKGLLANMRQEGQRIEDALEEAHKEFQDLNHQIGKKSKEGLTVIQLRAMQFELDHIRYTIEQLKQDKIRQDKLIEKQLQVVLEMSQSVSGLDKLKEKQLEEYNVMVAKANEMEVAEFVSGKLVRQGSQNTF